MIFDAFATVVLAIWNFLISPLPEVDISWPGVESLVTAIAQIDSLVPILGPLTMILGVLSALVVFVVIRLVLVIINIVWW